MATGRSTVAGDAPDEKDDVDAGLDEIDLALADTFPASDPPAWNFGRDRFKTEGIGESLRRPGMNAGKHPGAEKPES
jgi:hypothetical protein